MVLFDHAGCLRRYDSVNDILKEFYQVRCELYKKRKQYMEGMLGAESLKLDNIARFILEKIEGKIKVENLKKAEICKILKDRKYDPDPVTKWRQKIARDQGYEGDEVNQDEEEEQQQSSATKDYDYLLGMPIWNLTMEKKDDILKQQKAKGDELARLKAKSPSQLWLDDLDEFLNELDKYEEKEREEDNVLLSKAGKASGKGSDKGANKKVPKAARIEYLPSKEGKRIDVLIDPALIAKTEKDARSKEKVKKEDKKEISIVDLISSDKYDDSQVQEFVKNIGKPVKKEPVEKVKKTSSKKAEADGAGSDNDQVVCKNSDDSAKKQKRPRLPKSKGAKEDKEKNTLNNYFKKKSSDSTDESMAEVSLNDSTNISPLARRVTSRAKKEVKYDISSDEEGSKKSLKKLMILMMKLCWTIRTMMILILLNQSQKHLKSTS